VRRQENARVENAVLLGADQLLAIDEQDPRVRRADGQNFGNTPALVQLLDSQESCCHRLLSEDVVDPAITRSLQWYGRQVPIDEHLISHEVLDEWR